MSWRQHEEILLRVEKPGRYLGTEHGAVHKDPRLVRLHVALAFPEVYEIAQSHLGLQLLYRLLNRRADVYAERVYAPWLDMERELRTRALPLASLESATPLHRFHIVGFSLQYELTYTNLLAMLDLGGIPLRSAERNSSHPLVIAGGPCAFNPEPMASFIDAILIGDGEEAILDICDAYLLWNGRDRINLFARLAEIEGVYVPSLYRSVERGKLAFQCTSPLRAAPKRVRKRILTDLEACAPEPAQIVPLVRIVHDRASVEVMRGCVKGCRFCQAGYVYRPLRERHPGSLLQQATDLIRNTGCDELSLLSLSTGDYSCLDWLLTALVDDMQKNQVATSLPSTRVEALSPHMIRQIQRVRKTGFTLAPEAGTERLRRVIQKAYTEEQLTEAASRLFDLGWQHLKLYFMIGLPTESEEDLQGIVDLCGKLKRLGQRTAKITASASTFVPKPHTPFQWMAQISRDETARRQAYLNKALASIRVRFKWHNAAQSYIEGVWARADRKLGDTIERAFRLGCRFDGWTEQLRVDLWERAFAETGINPEVYLGERPLDDPLPWDQIDSGVSKQFLHRELDAALDEAQVPDCALERCTACGVCDFRTVRNVVYATAAAKGSECRGAGLIEPCPTGNLEDCAPSLSSPAPGISTITEPAALTRLRATHLKVGWSRFLGNLDLVATLIRGMRRAALPLAFTSGYRPAPRVSPGPALALGVESLCELIDLWLTEPVEPPQLLHALNQELPPELQMIAALPLPLSAPSIDSQISSFVYEVNLEGLPRETIGSPFLKQQVAAFGDAASWPIAKMVKGKKREVDAKEMATMHLTEERRLTIETSFGNAGAIKPAALLRSVLDLDDHSLARARIRKVETLMGTGSTLLQSPSRAALA